VRGRNSGPQKGIIYTLKRINAFSAGTKRVVNTQLLSITTECQGADWGEGSKEMVKQGDRRRQKTHGGAAYCILEKGRGERIDLGLRTATRNQIVSFGLLGLEGGIGSGYGYLLSGGCQSARKRREILAEANGD